ncbi:Putative transposase of IS4/5 family [Nitrosospira multiformis]|uniref:Putative transposase of IS4/5 family n=1 Tax=Nitrosospira multiformis TaxID=1231 RepID=A0A1I7FGX1_9PROT|nr:Putative transposase of IS4/5 family [Nitrosospira multiformis]
MKDSKPAYCRHDLSDETWALLEPHLPERKGAWGGIAGDNRRFIDAVFWILRDRSAVAGSSAGVRRVEQHASPFHTLAGQGCLGEVTGDSDRRAGLRVADD